jgi:hypothetical protein
MALNFVRHAAVINSVRAVYGTSSSFSPGIYAEDQNHRNPSRGPFTGLPASALAVSMRLLKRLKSLVNEACHLKFMQSLPAVNGGPSAAYAAKPGEPGCLHVTKLSANDN